MAYAPTEQGKLQYLTTSEPGSQPVGIFWRPCAPACPSVECRRRGSYTHTGCIDSVALEKPRKENGYRGCSFWYSTAGIFLSFVY